MKITIHLTWFSVLSVATRICISNANHLLKMMLEHAASTRNEINIAKQTRFEPETQRNYYVAYIIYII